MSLNIETTNVFHKNYNSLSRIKINRGGTRSGKTYNLLKLFVFWLLTGYINKEKKQINGVLSIVRKHNSTITRTVQRDLEEILDDMGIRDKIEINKTEKTYKYKNRMIEFFGADNQQKLRGGKREILYCNEANELKFDDEFFQLNIRTTHYVFIDFNPDDEDIWINQEYELKKDDPNIDVDIFVSTYKDNPFLGDVQIKEIELIKTRNKMKWRIYGLGEYGILEGLVFERGINWDIIDNVPVNAEYIGDGMDFGFTNDPTTQLSIYRYNSEIIIDQNLYRTGMTNTDIGNFNKGKNLNITADSAEPKSIEEIRRMGININPCVKGPDSIRYGIDKMKEYKLNITSRSTETIKEFKKYTWAKDKNGKNLNVPEGGDDHCIDAIRYVISLKLGNEKKPGVFIL